MSTLCKNKERNSLRCPRGAGTRKGTHWDVHVVQEQGKEVIEISTWQEQGKEEIEMSTWCKNKERKSLRCPRGWNKEQGTHWDVHVAGTRKGTHLDIHVVQEQGKELIEISTWCRNKERKSLRFPRGNKERNSLRCLRGRNKERNSLRCPRGWNKEQGTHWKNANTIGNIPSWFPVVFLQFGFQYVILCNPIQ